MGRSRSIVYFAYLGDEDTDDALVRRRLAFVERQLRWLAGLVALSDEPVTALVPYVAPRGWDGDVHDMIARHGFGLDRASIDADRRNRFEYPGFRALKALAETSAPDDLLYYCHSKGVVHLEENKMGLFKLHTEIGLTTSLDDFVRDPRLDRAGLFPSRLGWCWYNFFWVKAGYMAGRAVDEAADRYHFEALIGDRGDKEAYRRMLPLIDRVPFATGIAPQPWYRAEQTNSAILFATYDRYAALESPADARQIRA